MNTFKQVSVINLIGSTNTYLSCDKYDGVLYVSGETVFSGAGNINLYSIDVDKLIIDKNTITNKVLDSVSWFPYPAPDDYVWGFLNTQEIGIIESNGDGTFTLYCPDLYVQAQDADPSDPDPLPAIDISFPAKLKVNSDLTIDFEGSEYFIEGTDIGGYKKTSDTDGGFTYTTSFNDLDLNTGYLKSTDSEGFLSASVEFGVYDNDSFYDFNTINGVSFVTTYDTDTYINTGVVDCNVLCYLEGKDIANITTTEPKFKSKRKPINLPRGAIKAKESSWRFGTTFNSTLKKPRKVKGKDKFRPYR